MCKYRDSMRTGLPTFLLVALLGGIAVPPCPAADPPEKGERSWLHPWRSYESLRTRMAALRPPEIVEMLWSLAHGSQMGPGAGWFHPGESRYGWGWLAARHDTDHDGTITAEEFQGPADLFQRLDRNRDGVLTAEDFDWSARSTYQRQAGLAAQWFRLLDGNSNGRISREEWEAFFTKLAKEKGYVTPEDLREALHPPAPPRTAKGRATEGPSPLTLLAGLCNGELGSYQEGPRVGQHAPDFTLTTQDGGQRLRLAQYRGQKPVVLIFGSFT